MKKNQKGFSVVEILIVIVVIGLLGVVGWLVFGSQKSKSTNSSTTSQINQQEDKQKKESANQEEAKSNAPVGLVQYQDTVNGVSFYHPSDWKKSEIHIHKTSVSETVKGTTFGALYSAKYQFKKAENRWYTLNEEGNLVAPYYGDPTVTSIPASSYPAVYGLVGEGGWACYYAVFTDGTSSYMIELPAVEEVADTRDLDKQKLAIFDLVKTIKISN